VNFSRERRPDRPIPGMVRKSFSGSRAASGVDDLDDGRTDAPANAGQLHKTLKAPAAHHLIDRIAQIHQRSCCPSISREAKPVLVLKLKDVGHLAQLICR